MMAERHPDRLRLERTVFPDYSQFAESCYRGLSTLFSFKRGVTDPDGWKFGKSFPPSHPAFGRMRALLAVQDVLSFKSRKALEIAAGGAGLSVRLATSGCEVVVNDLREEVIKESVEEFVNTDGIRIECGNVFELSAEQLGKFDLVIACEIIEHVAHPDKLLRHLATFLEPQGKLFLTTPNGLYFRNKLPNYHDVRQLDELEARQFQPDADGHLYLLTPAELFELAEAAGLRVERLGAWGTPMLSGHAALRYLAGPPLIRLAYLAEVLAQRLPPAGRARACAALSATLRLQ